MIFCESSGSPKVFSSARPVSAQLHAASMKTFLLLVLHIAAVAHLSAQGTVNFANGAAGVNAPVTNEWGNLCAPANGNYYAMLYVGGPGITDARLLSTNGVGGGQTQIGTTSLGYFFGGVRTITGFGIGETVTMQVRVWNGYTYSSYEQAWEWYGEGDPNLRSGYRTATSELIQVTLGGGGAPTPHLVGIHGMKMVLPEPSAIWLVCLGLGLIATRRRRT
jgi:hypothetical protein